MKSEFRHYRILVSTLLGFWFSGAAIASAFLVFKNGRLPAAFVALAALLAFGVWASVSSRFRQFLLAADPRTLTFLQAWRVAGFALVVAGVYKILPNVFALPAGYGDLFIGLTAPFVATFLSTPERKMALVAWQALGVLDVLMAVTLGVLASPLMRVIGGGMTTAALTILPLSMVPTFAVPLVLILHITCLLKLGSGRQAIHGTVAAVAAQHSA